MPGDSGLVEKVAVIGLDGLSWRYLDKLMEHGAMPYTRRLVERAARSNLHSYPPTTPPAWASIMSGVNPGKHGVFSFTYIDKRTWEQRLYSALDLEHPRVHEMLAMAGVPSVVINPIPPHPIIPVRGLQVVSHHVFAPRRTYYPDYMERYAKLLAGRALRLTSSPGELMEALAEAMEAYRAVVEEIVAGGVEWRLLWLNLGIPDYLLHKAPYLLERCDRRETKLFNAVDRIIRILGGAADVVAVVSDHGFSYYDKYISINDLLVDHGLAVPAREGSVTILEHDELEEQARGLAGRSVKRVGLSLTAYKLMVRVVPKPVRELLKALYRRVTGRSIKLSLPGIDAKASRAFMGEHGSYGIYLNDPSALPEVLKALSEVPGLKVMMREEVYSGPYVDRAPHVMLYPDFDKGYNVLTARLHGSVLMRRTYADHHPLGVFMVYSDVVDVELPPRVATYHVTPVLMYLLGAPLPHDTDAKSLIERLEARLEVKACYEDYTGKWVALKRLYAVRGRMP